MFRSAVLSVCFYFSLVASQHCPEFSTYAECGCLLTCENPYPSEDCFQNCEPGCYCNPGYFLRNDGQCVFLTQCKIPEEYPPNTPDTKVPEEYQPNTPDTKVPEEYPPNTPDTNYKCGQDEEYYDCTPTCKNTCENINDQDAQCKCGPPACFCREGLVKRGDGKCVPPQECDGTPPDCPPNAIYIPCGSACAPTCEDPRIRSCEDKCVAACFCKPGYLLSKDGKMCVKPQHCNLRDIPVKTKPKCPEHAMFIQCGSACAPSCKNLHPEPCGDECVSACFCIPGYLMNNNSKCVRPNQCDTMQKPSPTNGRCGAAEQFYECTPSCKNTCKNYNNPGVDCGCGPPGCFCCEGLVKRDDGKCVHPNQCPVITHKCVENAVFVPCGSSCPPTCDNPSPQPCSQRCVPGCFCKQGFLQTKEGKCVLPQQCQKQYPPKCPENAIYQDCGTSCPKTCEDSYPSRCTLECVAGCFCKPGFLKRKDGKCVTPQQCDGKTKPERCGADEQYYECTPSCRNTCNNYNNPGGPLCRCGPPGCFCREGLVKREDGKCVRPNQCPGRCAADEQYYECTPSCNNTCKNYNFKGLPLCRCGPPGCFCRKGLVKRDDGRCVRPNQCPITPPRCLENAVFLPCGSPCPPTCANPNPLPCPHRCLAGCFCKHGFLQNEDGKCVLPQHCEKKSVARCREHAEYLDCGPACPETCENTQPRKPCIAACFPGCFCKHGFVKTKYGNCVPPSLCDKKCSLPEEEYVECGSTCPDTCDNRGHTPPGGCPSKCVRGCFCKKGLFRDLKGACVAPKDCPGQIPTSVETRASSKNPEN